MMNECIFVLLGGTQKLPVAKFN